MTTATVTVDGATYEVYEVPQYGVVKMPYTTTIYTDYTALIEYHIIEWDGGDTEVNKYTAFPKEVTSHPLAESLGANKVEGTGHDHTSLFF